MRLRKWWTLGLHSRRKQRRRAPGRFRPLVAESLEDRRLLTVVGPDFQVNTTTAGEQTNADVATDADGDFVVVWQSENQDPDGSIGIYGQRFDSAATPQGTEFRLNTTIAGDQTQVSVAVDDDGDFVAVWQSDNQDPDGSAGIYAQRYDASGIAQGGEFRINTTIAGGQTNPSVAMDNDGDFVVVWQDYGIYAQRFEATGVAQGIEFQVHSSASGTQRDPVVAMDNDGDFVVTWASDAYYDTYGILLPDAVARRFDSAGVAQGSEFLVNTQTPRIQTGNPDIAMDADGDFVIAYTRSEYYVYDDVAILVQRYDSSGVAQGSAITANTDPATQFNFEPNPTSVAMDDDGDFAVVWETYYFYDGYYGVKDIAVQRFDSSGDAVSRNMVVNAMLHIDATKPAITMDADGGFIVTWQGDYVDDVFGHVLAPLVFAPDGPIFPVNTTTSSFVTNPDVATDANGNFVIVWESNTQDPDGSSGIYGQRFDATRTPQGSEFRINATTAGAQRKPEVAMDAVGNFVVVWESFGQDPDGSSGVYAQRYDAAGAALGGEFRVNATVINDQRTPTVAMDDDGDFVIAWDTVDFSAGYPYYGTGARTDIFAQRYDSTGAAQGGEILINDTTGVPQGGPSVAMDADGDFVIAWTRANDFCAGGYFNSCVPYGVGLGYFYGQYGFSYGEAMAKRYNSAGVAQGTEWLLDTAPPTTQLVDAPSISVASDADGDFVIAWSFGDYFYNPGDDLLAQRYDSSGSAQGAKFLVNTLGSIGPALEPSVAMDADGDFVITWTGYYHYASYYNAYPDQFDIVAQRYDASGTPTGGDFLINSFSGERLDQNSAVAITPDGDFVVVGTQGDGTADQGERVTAQRFVDLTGPGDDDDDGVTGAVEDGAPNGGDGNNDGTLDSEQSNVTSLPNFVDAQYVTLVSPADTSFNDVSAVENPSPGNAPAGVIFPVGFFEYEVQNVTPGGATTVEILLPVGVDVDTFYKYGPEPGNATDHWYEFLFDGTTGAEIFTDRVILHFVDGQRGDDDLTANGVIVEPGAPAVIPNASPTANAGGPYDVAEGGTVSLDASASSDPDQPSSTLTYEWDLDGDNIFGETGAAAARGDEIGINPTFDADGLDGPGTVAVSLKVTDNLGESDTDTAEIDVLNVAPTADDDAYAADVFILLVVSDADGTTTSGDVTDDGVLVNDTDPAGPINDPLMVTTSGVIITNEGATVTMNADGTFIYNATTSGSLLSLNEGVTLDDTFSYEISDGDGGFDTATVTVTVTGASENSVHIIDCPCGDGTKAVIVRGSANDDDKIDIKLGSMADTIQVKIKGSIGGSFRIDVPNTDVSKVIAYGLDGNDDIKVHSNASVNGWLFGGAGNDKLRGGDLADVLVGGDGDDKLDGKKGRDILIGGDGADKLKGHKDEDILIAGSTAYDNNLAALCGIHQEWTSANSFEDRVNNVFDGSGGAGGANGSFFFDNTTVQVSDGDKDELDGGSGSDWFIADEVFDGDKVKGFDDDEDIFGLDADWFDIDP